MASTLSLYMFFIITLLNLRNKPTTAISVYKSAGSLYFGVLPSVNGKISHESLPSPVNEESRIIGGASYYLNKANNKVYDLLQSFFGTSNEEDPQLNTGIYDCHDGLCKPMELTEHEEDMLKESLKGKEIHMGNALTKKVKETVDNRTSIQSPPPTQYKHQ